MKLRFEKPRRPFDDDGLELGDTELPQVQAICDAQGWTSLLEAARASLYSFD